MSIDPIPPSSPPPAFPPSDPDPSPPTGPQDTIFSANSLVSSQNPVASKPGLLAYLKKMGTARSESFAQLFASDAQDADLRKSFYIANAEAVLTGAQRAQLLIQTASIQLQLAVELNGFFDPVAVQIANENANAATENSQTSVLNGAINSYNSAKAAYDSDQSPANLAALNSAISNYATAKANYDSFSATRNSDIDSYNAAITPTQNTLDSSGGINEIKQQINQNRAELGLPPLAPEQYELIRDHMPASPAIPTITTPALTTLPNRPFVDITNYDLATATIDFVSFTNAAVGFLTDDSEIGRRFADVSAARYDFIAFKLKNKVNPGIIPAIVEHDSKTKTDDGSAPVLGPASGSGAMLASLSSDPGNVTLKEQPGIAEYEGQSTKENVQDDPQLFEQRRTKLLGDIDAVGTSRIRDIKLIAAIKAREQLGTGFSYNNPALRAVAGLETINGIQALNSSSDIDETITAVVNQAYKDNPELGEAVRDPLIAALKIQYQFTAANELAESLGDPDVTALLLLATPGLEQLRTLLAGSSTMRAEDMLSGSFSDVYLKVNLANTLAQENDLDPNEAAREASQILNEVFQTQPKTAEQVKLALVEALGRRIGNQVSSRVIDAILKQMGADRNVASLNRPLVVQQNRRQDIINQVTPNASEQAALLAAYNIQFATAQDLQNNAIVQLNNLGIDQARSAQLAEQFARVSVLDSAVTGQFNNKLKQLPPDERKRVESEFLSTISVPQKVKIEDQEAQANPLSIPSQISNIVNTIRTRGDESVTDGILEDAKKASREDFDSFLTRTRAQHPGRFYLQQTMEGGGPFVGTSELPKSNFASVATSISTPIINI